MKSVFYIIGIAVIIILFQLQDKLRKPVYSRMHNVWNEDKDSILMANAIMVVMLIMAFILGLHI
jgi:hypothetical protein